MIRNINYPAWLVLPAFTVVIILTFGICMNANAQSSTVQKSTASQPMRLQTSKVDKAELKRFCGSNHTTSSKRGRTTRYSCQSNPAGNGLSIQALPVVERSEIDCSYSESGGVIKWLGCTCKANDEGNCNNFISNCVEGGDDVGGNSGGASCSPPGG